MRRACHLCRGKLRKLGDVKGQTNDRRIHKGNLKTPAAVWGVGVHHVWGAVQGQAKRMAGIRNRNAGPW